MKKYYLLIILTLGLLFIVTGCATVSAAEPGPDGQVYVSLDDYTFEPNTIRLKAGQTVSFVLANDGEKVHEFMVGRNIQVHDGHTEPFAEDFFEGIEVKSFGPGNAMRMGEMGGMDMGNMDMEGMDMGAEGEMEGMDMSEEGGMQEMDMAEEDHQHDEGEEHTEEGMDMGEEGSMQGMDMEEQTEEGMDMGPEGEEHQEDMAMEAGHEESGEHEEESMDMQGMDMGEEGDMQEEEHQEEMTMEPDHQEESMDMQGMDMGEGEGDGHEHEEGTDAGEFGAFQTPLMDMHPGFMVMLDPLSVTPSGQVTILTFTVPEDKVGTWTIGCFQEGGQHFDDGMQGTLIVEP